MQARIRTTLVAPLLIAHGNHKEREDDANKKDADLDVDRLILFVVPGGMVIMCAHGWSPLFDFSGCIRSRTAGYLNNFLRICR